MRRFLCALLAAVAVIGFASVASAADMPVKAPMIAPVYNWTGFYVGGTVGSMYGDYSYVNLGNGFASVNNNVRGALGGPTIGLNWQTGAFVLGIEGDYSWSKAKATDLSGCSAPGCEASYRWIATARGRIGYAFDRFLPYVTGGAAFTRLQNTFLPTGADNGSRNLTGWTLGAGLEWAFWQNWSVKAEYLHVDFGHPVILSPIIGLNIRHNASNLNIVRVGLNYKFGWF